MYVYAPLRIAECPLQFTQTIAALFLFPDSIRESLKNDLWPAVDYFLRFAPIASGIF